MEFFQQASQYGDLYVGIGSDATYLEYKHRKPMFPQEERLFMVKNIKAVKDAYINEGSGVSEDMAGEVAEDGSGDARPTGILLREQSGASRWYHLGCPGFYRYLCSGLVRHYYDNNFWPEKIESTQDEMTLRFLEDHLVMIPMEPRRPGCSVVEGKDITPEKVKALADAADACWKAILAHDLDAFAAAYRASFEAQIAMFPGMVNPSINGVIEPEASVQPMIDRYSSMEDVIGCGLTCLETSANPYTTVLGHPDKAESRINLSQSLNGIGWIVGPLVGGQLLFSGVNIAIPYALVGIFVLSVALVLLVCAILTFVATLIVVVCSGTLSLIAFFALYLGESIMFPTIFSLALRDAGTKTKLASSLLIMTIVGGAVAPVIMGYIADTTGSMAIAFLIPLVCYGVIGGYALSKRSASL